VKIKVKLYGEKLVELGQDDTYAFKLAYANDRHMEWLHEQGYFEMDLSDSWNEVM
jgi:hypothetical protein